MSTPDDPLTALRNYLAHPPKRDKADDALMEVLKRQAGVPNVIESILSENASEAESLRNALFHIVRDSEAESRLLDLLVGRALVGSDATATAYLLEFGKPKPRE